MVVRSIGNHTLINDCTFENCYYFENGGVIFIKDDTVNCIIQNRVKHTQPVEVQFMYILQSMLKRNLPEVGTVHMTMKQNS